MTSVNRLRANYIAFACVAIAVGLIVHLRGEFLAPAVRDVLGDALWAVMIAAWVSAVSPITRGAIRCSVALSICFVVEFSQLWRTPALDNARATLLGRLVLGSGFDPRDLVAYTAGILAFAWLDRKLQLSPKAQYLSNHDQ